MGEGWGDYFACSINNATVVGNWVVNKPGGIRQFPYPHLRYGCGMGKCSKCASRIVEGAEHLPAPNWKERKILGANLERGYRLVCQLWIHDDVALCQDSDEVWAATIKPPEESADLK